MAPVSSIRNLGPSFEAACAAAGIHSAEELRDLGADAAYAKLDTSDNLLCRPRSPWRTAFCARYRGSLGLMGWFSVRAGVRRAHLG